MFAAFTTLSMSFTTLMQTHLTLLLTLSFYNVIIDCEFLILYLFTVCDLREMKLPTSVLNEVYCIVCIYINNNNDNFCSVVS